MSKKSIMRKTPLIRKTPMSRGTSQMKRTPMKPWRRKPDDAMSPEVRLAILNRDRVCFVFEYVDRSHVCHNEWGDEHAPSDVLQLTVEHVKVHLRAGKRAQSRTIENGLALCHGANVGVPSKVLRAKMRDRLARLYPSAWEGHE